MIDYLDYFLDFVGSVLEYIIFFVVTNKYVLSFVLLPIALCVIFVVIDFIFDIRDNFTEFNKFVNTNTFRKDMRKIYKRRKKRKNDKSTLDMSKLQKKESNYINDSNYYINSNSNVDGLKTDYLEWLENNFSKELKRNKYFEKEYKKMERDFFIEQRKKEKQNQYRYYQEKKEEGIDLDIEVED